MLGRVDLHFYKSRAIKFLPRLNCHSEIKLFIQINFGKQTESNKMEYKHLVQLKKEFENLGFSMKDIEMEDNFLKGANLFHFSVVVPMNDPRVQVDFFSALFTGRIVDGETPVIDQVHATVSNAAPNGTKQILSSESFEPVNGVLPTKQQMVERFADILRAKQIHEKFKMNNGQQGIQKQNETNRKNRF